MFPGVIKQFRGQHPDVDLHLTTMNNAALKQALCHREMVIAIAGPSIIDDEFISEIVHQ